MREAKTHETQSKRKKKALSAKDLMKLEIAEELGLLEKYRAVGWAGLSAQEAGAIGGVMSHRLRTRKISDESQATASPSQP